MASPVTEAEVVRVRVAGKVNLSLRSGRRRPDGYHSLSTVFQAVSLYDEVDASWAPPGRFSVQVVGEQADQVPTGDDNLAVRAARLLARTWGAGKPLGADLVIRKSIPVAGGMAGGSADAAGALLACAVLWDLDISPDELRTLGARLGADVPFCLAGGTALGRGRGDELTSVLSRGTYHWVLAFSDGELSTPAVFARFDELGLGSDHLDVPDGLLNALVSGDVQALGRSLVNDLEPAALALRPQLSHLLEAGDDLGAVASMVSGSGPTVAFLAANEPAAVDLSVRLSSEGLCRAVKRVSGPVPGARLLV
ncbi:4-diphosphocytidyl-2-C-methyl-D-erythritol kinase [Propionicimonas sp. T2.31MG-18]|uniref:4-(cytidine 5'-diphospho)-2-C-methyl-D-erythritol kinase n=1 Tax=Propionicimonas sp. T2.31MG-18 TaxID=3157620 RepID=UPI0035E89EA3